MVMLVMMFLVVVNGDNDGRNYDEGIIYHNLIKCDFSENSYLFPLQIRVRLIYMV
jgi:hypothetical protein